VSRRKPGIRSAVESSAQHEYEFTTPRIVLLVIAIVLWLLFGVAAMARDDDGSGSYRFGLLLGSLFVSLLLSWIVRSLYRLIRRRPVLYPAWTPGLFFGAVVIQILSAAGNSTPS
jgi:uncharacterized BrkB/YihY/UPF0761 family membrane protein